MACHSQTLGYGDMNLTVAFLGVRGLREGHSLPGTPAPCRHCTLEVLERRTSQHDVQVFSDHASSSWTHEPLRCYVTNSDTLSFSVVDRDHGLPDDVLGKATLSSSKIGLGGFDGELRLYETMDDAEAYLWVCIAAERSTQPDQAPEPRQGSKRSQPPKKERGSSGSIPEFRNIMPSPPSMIGGLRRCMSSGGLEKVQRAPLGASAIPAHHYKCTGQQQGRGGGLSSVQRGSRGSGAAPAEKLAALKPSANKFKGAAETTPAETWDGSMGNDHVEAHGMGTGLNHETTCTDLGSLLGLMRHLLSIHEVKFAISLLETLTSSKISGCKLPVTKLDMAQELQGFMEEQSRLCPSSALHMLEITLGCAVVRGCPATTPGLSSNMGPIKPKDCHAGDRVPAAAQRISGGSPPKGLFQKRRFSDSNLTGLPTAAPRLLPLPFKPPGLAATKPKTNVPLATCKMFAEPSSKKTSANSTASGPPMPVLHSLAADWEEVPTALPTAESSAEVPMGDGPLLPRWGMGFEVQAMERQPSPTRTEDKSSSSSSALTDGSSTSDDDTDGSRGAANVPDKPIFRDNSDVTLGILVKYPTCMTDESSQVGGGDDEEAVEDNDDFDDLSMEQMNWLARKSDRFVLHPNKPVRLGWDLLSLIFILSECVTVPLVMAFDVYLPEKVQSISTVFFAIDILLSFNTGYFQGCILVMRRRWLTWKYIRTWLVLDFVSTFPWELIFKLVGKTTSQADDKKTTTLLRIVKLGKLMRVLRLLRLAKINSLIMRFQSSGMLPASMYELKFALAALKMFVVFGFLSHWSACIWGWLGISSQSEPYDISICTMGGPCEPGIEGSQWIQRYALDNYSGATQYLAALQFTAALITGGEAPMQASRAVERVFTILVSIGGIFVTSVAVGEILLIMNRQSEMNMAFEEQMQQSREFLVEREVPVSLQVRIYRYMESQHRQHLRSAAENRAFMERLSGWLQVQLVEYLHKSHLCRHPFFKQIENEMAIRRLCLEAKPTMFANGDPVVEEAQLALSAHFLVTGKLRVNLHDHRGVLYLKPPCWIGDRCLFVDTLRTNTVYAICHTETLSVLKATVQTVCMEFADVKALHEDFRQKIMNNDLGSLRCPCCGDIGHAEETCPQRQQSEDNEKAKRKTTRRRLSAAAGVVWQARPTLRSSTEGLVLPGRATTRSSVSRVSRISMLRLSSSAASRISCKSENQLAATDERELGASEEE